MESEIVAPATPTETAPPVEPQVETHEDASIADHEAQFGKNRPTTEEPAQERPRHRAKSQQASTGDAPRINELTRKLREAERERDEWKAKHSAPPALEPARITRNPDNPVNPAPASDKPSWRAFEALIGEKYETWADAQDAWIESRDEWKETQQRNAYAEQQQSTAQQAVLQGYSSKAQEYAKSTPDFFDKMSAAAPVLDHIPDLLFQAIVRHDNGPELAYYLVTHPSDLDDMCLAADGKSVSDASVALLQRRLSHYRAPAAPTGSVAAVTPPRLAPRPPNPVRTGPLKTGDDPPGDDASIAEHEKHFGKRRR